MAPAVRRATEGQLGALTFEGTQYDESLLGHRTHGTHGDLVVKAGDRTTPVPF